MQDPLSPSMQPSPLTAPSPSSVVVRYSPARGFVFLSLPLPLVVIQLSRPHWIDPRLPNTSQPPSP